MSLLEAIGINALNNVLPLLITILYLYTILIMTEIILHYLNINTIIFTIGDYQMSYIEFVGTLFNILCVYLVSKNKIRNRPVGLIGSLLYVALFYQIQLYADL